MSEFIKLDIDLDTCLGIKKCGECIREDECTLCNLCLQGCEK